MLDGSRLDHFLHDDPATYGPAQGTRRNLVPVNKSQTEARIVHSDPGASAWLTGINRKSVRRPAHLGLESYRPEPRFVAIHPQMVPIRTGNKRDRTHRPLQTSKYAHLEEMSFMTRSGNSKEFAE